MAVVQSELGKTILSVNNNASNLVEKLETHSNRLDAFRSNIHELTINTSAIQNDLNNIGVTANVNDGRLRVHDSRLDHLNANVNAINTGGKLALKNKIESFFNESYQSFIYKYRVRRSYLIDLCHKLKS